MSETKYVAAIWIDYTKHNNGFKILSSAKRYGKRPTKKEALIHFGKLDEYDDYEFGVIEEVDGVEAWYTSSESPEAGWPIYSILTISTEEQMDKMLETIAEAIRERIK